MIPALNDHELEALVDAAAEAGASNAAFMLLRLPHELGTLFEQWLREHYPQRADRVLEPAARAARRPAERSALRPPHARRGCRTPRCWPRGSPRPAAATGSTTAAAPELDCSQFLRDPAAPRQGDLFG